MAPFPYSWHMYTDNKCCNNWLSFKQLNAMIKKLCKFQIWTRGHCYCACLCEKVPFHKFSCIIATCYSNGLYNCWRNRFKEVISRMFGDEKECTALVVAALKIS